MTRMSEELELRLKKEKFEVMADKQLRAALEVLINNYNSKSYEKSAVYDVKLGQCIYSVAFKIKEKKQSQKAPENVN